MNKKKIAKKKINKSNLWAIIIACIALFAFICLIVGILAIATLLSDKPTLNLQDFEQAESSVIYDYKGEEVANLGTVIRQNVEYEEIPNCVVDAFVAIEDSRFFQHNGFDIPRFTKAILENIRTMSFGQGGSTFTMQLVKNTYFTDDSTGEEASRSGVSGVRRKVQEIALALELEHYEPKQFIFESYLNKLNYGGDRNIRGIQKAAQYYFSKDVSELNLNEAALLAGVINAPNYYNPFNNLEAAQERVEQVLYQMYNHGYIEKEEYELAKTVKIEDLLTDPYASAGSGDGIPYQAYVDAVVNETIELTGLDPYTTTMHIYTYMNQDIQTVMDNIQAQGKDDYLAFPDDYVECASVCIDNSTGQVVGILGGRNYADGGQLLLNHATEQYKQPGSSIKPILDYALAFENLGWATDHVLHDVPMYMDSSKLNLVYNFSNTYVGDVTLKQALGESINTCAIQTLQAVIDKMKNEYVVNYAQSLGYDFSLNKFNVQYGIGGSTCEVTPYQHAGAYAAIMNGGVYNTPHTIQRIEFTNGKSPITPVYESKQVISEQAAYLTTQLMKSNVQSYGGSYDVVKNDNYVVYAKTGTTDWGIEGKEYGIPSGSNKDAWLIASTSEYTTATWVGYEKAVAGQPSYITNDFYYTRPQAKIAHLILEECYTNGGSKPTEISKPSGISTITHIIGTWPYASPKIDGVELDPSLITTGEIKTDSVKLVTLSAPDIENLSDASASLGSNGNTIVLSWAKYPNDAAVENEEHIKDTSLKAADGSVIVPATGKVLFDSSWIYGSVYYCADIVVNGKTVSTVQTSDNSKEFVINTSPGDKVSAVLYYSFKNSSNTSNKITKDAGKVTTTISFPSSGNEDSLKAFASKYSGIVKFVKNDPIGDTSSFTITSSTNGSTDLSGTSVTVGDSTTYTINYYPAMDYSIKIVESTSGSDIILTASSNDTDFDWDYDDELEGWSFTVSDDHSKLTVSYDDSKATTSKTTVTVSNSKEEEASYTIKF